MDAQGMSCNNAEKHNLAKQIIAAMHRSPGYATAPLENDFLMFYLLHKADPDELYSYVYGVQDALVFACNHLDSLNRADLTEILKSIADTFFTVVQRDFPDSDLSRYEGLKNFARGDMLS